MAIPTTSTSVRGLEQSAAYTIWTLEECIQLALDQNVQVRQSKLSTQSNEVNLESARVQCNLIRWFFHH